MAAAPTYPPLHELALAKEKRPEPRATAAFPWEALTFDLQNLVLNEVLEEEGCKAWGRLCQAPLAEYDCTRDATWKHLHEQCTRMAFDLQRLINDAATPDKVKDAKRPSLQRLAGFTVKPGPFFGRSRTDGTVAFDDLSGTSIEEAIPLKPKRVDLGWRREFIFRCGLERRDATWWHAPSRTSVIAEQKLQDEGSYDRVRTVLFVENGGMIQNGLLEGQLALETVLLPDRLSVIGADAFVGCAALKNLKLPDTVTEIRTGAFANCTNLTLVGNRLPPMLTKLEDYVFTDCEKLELSRLPDGILEIGSGAFDGCRQLRLEQGLPNGLQTIQIRAFCDCESLELKGLPNSLTVLADTAFLRCSASVKDLARRKREELWFERQRRRERPAGV